MILCEGLEERVSCGRLGVASFVCLDLRRLGFGKVGEVEG